METRLVELLAEFFPEAEHIEVIGFEPIPGGYSRETYRFDAVVKSPAGEEHHPLILRKDPPPAVSILQTSREIEHDLIEALRLHTNLPIGRSLGHEPDPEAVRRAGDGHPADARQLPDVRPVPRRPRRASRRRRDAPPVRGARRTPHDRRLHDRPARQRSPTRATRASTRPRGTPTWTRRSTTTSGRSPTINYRPDPDLRRSTCSSRCGATSPDRSRSCSCTATSTRPTSCTRAAGSRR